MGLPAIAEIITRGSGWGSASERSASEVVPRVMRAPVVAYITLRIQTSVTQELVGLPTVAAVYRSSTRPASGRQIVIPETRPDTQLGLAELAGGRLAGFCGKASVQFPASREFSREFFGKEPQRSDSHVRSVGSIKRLRANFVLNGAGNFY
jgi:hypothetical protein